jgi:hypothetical protein
MKDMNTKQYALIGIACLLISGCATMSENPQQDILGVWEVTRVLDLRPQDAGFVENIKLVFQPEGKLYKMGPTQDEFAERKLYGYKIDGTTLVRTRSDLEDVRTSFSIYRNTLVITETDGSSIHFTKRSSDFSKIPTWEPRTVPFTVNYTTQQNKIVRKEQPATIIPLATVQKLKRARIECWDLEERLAIFITDDTQDVAGILDCGNLSKEQAFAIIQAKKKELDGILDDEATEHNERVRRNKDANKSSEATR